MFPRSTALGLEPVSPAKDVELPGFDQDEVEAKLGQKRFAGLMKTVESVFCCNHRKYPEGHPTMPAGYEVHCIYATDLEKFLSLEHAN